MNEAQIQNAICEYLAYRKHFFWRQNNTPVFDATRQVYRKMPKYALKGVPDIQVITNPCGQAVFLEVKKKGGYQSKEQKEFERNVKERGGEYYVVRSVEDVQEIGL